MLSAIIATRDFGTSARSHTGRAGPWCCCRPDRRGRHCGRRFAGRHGRDRRDRRVPLHQFKRSLGGPAECCRNKHPQPLADLSSRGCCAAARLDRRSRPLHAVNRRPRGRGSRRRVSPARACRPFASNPRRGLRFAPKRVGKWSRARSGSFDLPSPLRGGRRTSHRGQCRNGLAASARSPAHRHAARCGHSCQKRYLT